MAINNTRISVSELDFDNIKTSLKTFLSAQSTFTDYDFDGSSMSMLLDVLAYNTHYRAIYDNFMLNEMFLDSASKRSSVVSRAKELGYTPTSVKSSTAYINFILTNTTNGPDLFVLPKYTPFITTINGITYTFITTEVYSTTLTNGAYTINNVKLTQGSHITNRFNVTDGVKYVIPNTNVDTSTLSVLVQTSATSSTYNSFLMTDSFVGIQSSDKVFWVKEINGGLYELEFGNGVIGQGLTNGNIVQADYIVSDGAITNGAKLFRYIGPDLFSGSVALVTVSQSSGGADIESTESIKFNAPRLYSAQNRAVTVDDYRNLIYNLVSEAASVNVWSGSDNVPPEYGKVFICIKPKTIEKFTNVEKVAIISDIVSTKNVVSVIPEIVDPQYIKVAVDSTIYYDPKSTTKTVNDIKLIVQNAIINYNTSELEKFNGVMRFSKLTRTIDDADSSIISNVTNIVLHRVVEPKYNIQANYSINLVNPIHFDTLGGTIMTTGFKINGSDAINYMSDDGSGNIMLYTLNGSNKQIINPTIGSVNYTKGLIKILGLNITSIIGSSFDFLIKPSSYDVVSILDQLVRIPTELINVNVVPDLSLGASGGGANYQFTSSRS